MREKLLAQAGSAKSPTLLLDVVAEMLIERCARAATDGDLADLAGWAETVCHSRPDAPSVRKLMLSIGATLTQTLGEHGFEVLSERLTPIVNSVTEAAPDTGTDTIDEVDVMLADMVARVEFNDPITAEHCRAVSAWCARIANRLELSRREAAFVARGGLIHDVGKSVTPAEILQAPRPLTPAEWLVMREHVLAGHELISEHAHLREFAGVVRSHHERFDGGGYPDQLDRTRIPIAVRIVTVADAFNAMIGRRPYRIPLSPDRAAAELRRNTGTQFDPNVVAALLDVIGGGRESMLAEKDAAR